jgi:hypothetical protein
MSRSVSMIGLSPGELPWIRILLALLRHPDATVPELTRQALLYLSHTSATPPSPCAGAPESHENGRMLNCLK